MQNNIEVELRGPLSKDKFEELIGFFDKNGKFVQEKNRIVICFPDPNTGSYVENCFIDIRVRTTNGIPELIVKKGRWGGKEHRKELSIVGQEGEFEKFVEIMAAMGFGEGKLLVRLGKIYAYKDVEFSLVEVPGHSYYFEAEKLVNKKSDMAEVQSEIEEVCTHLGLQIFADKEFYHYIDVLNAEVNEVFDLNNFKEGYFKQRFGL